MLDYVKPEVVQKFLDALPAALALMDHDEKVIWVNGSFLRITCLERDDVIGKRKQDLPLDAQSLFTDDHVYLPENRKRDAYWLACMSTPLEDYTLQYCSDVTQLQGLIEDRENLKSKVAELNPIDQATGLPNRRALFQSLEQQCSRSRRYGNALSIMLLRMDNLAEYTKIFGGDNTNQLLLQVSQALNDQTRWADMIGRLDSNEFLLILPETEEIETRGLKEKLNTAMAAINLPGAEGTDFCLSVNFGMGQWRKGDDSDMLMQRAKQNLQGEKEEKLAV
jgi:diguanylate cyclase (GGDEF)-like protein